MWDQLLAAIQAKNSAEAIRLIGQMSPGDFVKDYTKLQYNQSPIHSAAYQGLADVVEQLLNKKPDLAGMVENNGYTALHLAVQYGSEPIVNKLLQLKPDLAGMVNTDGYTALHYAASNGSEPIVNKLLQLKPDLAGMVDNSGYTALHRAASNGREPIVNKLLQLKPDLAGMVDKNGYTALHRAASNGREPIVNKLLQLKPDLIGMVDKNGYTALHFAASNGREPIVNKLLQLKPDLIGMVTIYGYTALHCAALQHEDQIAGNFSPEMLATVLRLKDKNNDDQQIRKFLQEAITTYDNDIKAKGGNANAYFKKANVLYALNRTEEALNNYEKALELDEAKYIEQIVLNMSANLVNANVNGQTALHIAALNGYNEMTKIMLDKINPQVINSLDKDGKTMLYRAADSGREKAAELLASKMDAQVIGKTLIKAAKEGNKAVVKILVDKLSAEILAYQEVDGRTALHWAVQHSHDEITEMLLGKMSKEAVLLEDNRGRTAWHLSSSDAVADKIVQKMGQELPAINKFSTTTAKAENSNSNNNNSESSKAKEQNPAASTQKKAISYSAEEITKLLEIQIGKQAIVKMIDLRNGKLSFEEIEELVKPTIEQGQTMALALYLREQYYTSLIVTKNDDNLQVIYNDSRGVAFAQEKNVKSLIRGIKDLEDTASVIDLRQNQQVNEGDSAAFVIDNLVTLAKNSAKDLKKPELQKLLSTSQQIESIKAAHSLIGDDNPWYSDDKLKKLLEIELKGKEVSIAPAVVFENKELLVEVTKTAAKEVMESGHPTVVPVHVHGNHWTGLVIKKQADGSLQVIYNDPKGDELMNEKHSGALVKAIGKVNPNMHIVDLHKSQQANDDDCGVFTVDNLVKLASCRSDLNVAAMQGLLATADSNGKADNLRMNHANELCDAGIPVAVPHDMDLTGESTPLPI